MRPPLHTMALSALYSSSHSTHIPPSHFAALSDGFHKPRQLVEAAEDDDLTDDESDGGGANAVLDPHSEAMVLAGAVGNVEERTLLSEMEELESLCRRSC